MGTLHLVNHSPTANPALAQCLQRAGQGDAVLLLENGVYAAMRGGSGEALLLGASGRVSFHVLVPDLEARGLAPAGLAEGVLPVDYRGFVALTLVHHPIVSWF